MCRHRVALLRQAAAKRPRLQVRVLVQPVAAREGGDTVRHRSHLLMGALVWSWYQLMPAGRACRVKGNYVAGKAKAFQKRHLLMEPLVWSEVQVTPAGARGVKGRCVVKAPPKDITAGTCC